jgi:hypothetical protein
MVKQNSSGQDYTNATDGFTIGGGTTERILTVTGGNPTITASGTNVYTMPSATDTLVGRASTDVLTNKNLNSSTNTFLSGMKIRRGYNEASGGILGTSYATYATVTATSIGGVCQADWVAMVQNAGSGATRSFSVRVTCDGVAITPTSETLTAIYANGEYPPITFSYKAVSTPTAGSHVWNLQFLAAYASSVNLLDNILEITEITP